MPYCFLIVCLFSSVNSTAYINEPNSHHLRIFDYSSQLVLFRLLWAKISVLVTLSVITGASIQVLNDWLPFWNMLPALHSKNCKAWLGSFAFLGFEFAFECKEWAKQRCRERSNIFRSPHPLNKQKDWVLWTTNDSRKIPASKPTIAKLQSSNRSSCEHTSKKFNYGPVSLYAKGAAVTFALCQGSSPARAASLPG